MSILIYIGIGIFLLLSSLCTFVVVSIARSASEADDMLNAYERKRGNGSNSNHYW